MKINPLPSLEYLNECFELDETCPSGLRWKVRPQHHFSTAIGRARTNGKCANKNAGVLALPAKGKGKAYFKLKIARVTYVAHRVVYTLHHNVVLPVDIEVDHEDGNGLNNLPTNLRLATRFENMYNAVCPSNNTSGTKGVSWSKAHHAWRADVKINGKQYYLGTSPSKEIVEQIVREFREKHHKEFHNHGLT